MCDIFREIMKDDFKKAEERGLSEGRAEGEKRLSALTRILLESGQQDLLMKAISDQTLREQLYTKYEIA